MLTEKRIRDAKPGAATFIMWDFRVRGLGVRVTPAGAKSYVVDYRVGGRRRRATLARCSELPLQAARERAGRELVGVRAGESDPLERRREARDAPTVDQAVQRYFDESAPARIRGGRLKASTVREYRKHARRYVGPGLGRRRVADVTPRDVERLVDPLTRIQRNRVLAFVSHLFNLCEGWEWRTQHTNPARGIERAPEAPRSRVLDFSELAALSAALGTLDERFPASVAAIRVTAFTGLRISEVCSIRWEHVDFKKGCVTLPDTKTGPRVHHVPDAGLDVIRGILRINDEWVFSTGRSHVTYRYVRTVFAEAAKQAGLADVRLHDLRRTVVTAAAARGVGVYVIRDLLGHKTTAMADRYVQAVGAPVADVGNAVGAQIAAAMAGQDDADGAEGAARSRRRAGPG